MKKTLLLAVLPSVLVGCAVPTAVMNTNTVVSTSLGYGADITKAYHAAIMQDFDQAELRLKSDLAKALDRAAVTQQVDVGGVKTTKTFVDTAFAQKALVVQAKKMAELNANRQKFVQIYERYMTNVANAQNLLAQSSDLVMRSQQLQKDFQQILTEMIADIGKGTLGGSSVEAALTETVKVLGTP